MTPSLRSPEYTIVEEPFLKQLKLMGWEILEGNIHDPSVTERESFGDVLLVGRLREAVRRINVADGGREWLDEGRVNQMVGQLERISGSAGLMETNREVTDLLLKGTAVEGDPVLHGGRDRQVHFIDWQHPENNDFLAINQFRVDPSWAIAGKHSVIPDIVLFVNGIPLVVIECKGPHVSDPINEAINQLQRYTNQRDWVSEPEGMERLFYTNQLLVATDFDEAVVGTICAPGSSFVQWKDTWPVPQDEVQRELGVERLSSQQLLVAGMLRPGHLLDLVAHFTLFQQRDSAMIKIVGRYQQFRAVHKTIERLRTGKTRAEDGEHDRRGGIIWHTQGSGKSLTMVFLVRKMRATPGLQGFKIVVVTDRTALEEQLTKTAALTGETIVRAPTMKALQPILRRPTPEIVFATIQKYQQRDGSPNQIAEISRSNASSRMAAEDGEPYDIGDGEVFPVLNESENILVLVDEAHRSQASALHANLEHALPNSAMVGFTGTPIIMSEKKRTHEIFGSFIDTYTITQSEDDGVTVPIKYMGRTADTAITDGRTLDQLFEDMFRDRTPEEVAEIQRKYATQGDVLEARKLIALKARDMLRIYVEQSLPDGFKAQVVASSRLAAVRYQEELTAAIAGLVEQLDSVPTDLHDISPERFVELDDESRYLALAWEHRETIKRLEATAVISGYHNEARGWESWTDKRNQNVSIERFKRPLVDEDNPEKQDGLAFLCVKSMLLTGFDAPVEQMLFLDRKMQGHELLQAIARVNRTSPGKENGLVVDYYGVANHLKEALAVYAADDIEGALTSIRDSLPVLEDRHQRIMGFFAQRGISNIHGQEDEERCIQLLVDDVKLRAKFIVLLDDFLDSLGIIMPRREALPYVRDATQLGRIRHRAGRRARDGSLLIGDVSEKVQQLIDNHIEASKIDLKIGWTQITADEFKAEVAALPSARAQASEMEHAARYHISQHINEDPVFYETLSERLEEILDQFEGRWEQMTLQIETDVIDVIKRGRQRDDTGLDPQKEAPFYDVLRQELSTEGDLDESHEAKLRDCTVEMVKHIQRHVRVVDFWRNVHYQDKLRNWIARYLDNHDLVAYERQLEVADRLLQLARQRHEFLVS